MNIKALVDGVNEGPFISGAGEHERPAALHDNQQKREVLLVDRRGNPLLVREPRPIGFRKP